MNTLRLGLQLYTVRDDAAADLQKTLCAVAEMGYDGVELAGLYGHTPTQVRTLAQEAGLQVISAHVGLDVFRGQGIRETVSAYREIGVRYLAIPHLMPEDRPDSPTFAKTKAEIASIASECQAQGITLLYHNHDFEFAKLPDGRTFLEVLYDCAPQEQLQTELDTCWAHIVGQDPAEILRRYAGRAPLVHLKDYRGDRPASHYEELGIPHIPDPNAEPLELQAVGYGVQDIPSVMEAAKDAKSEWLIVEQDTPAAGMTAMDSARLSASYVRSVLGA